MRDKEKNNEKNNIKTNAKIDRNELQENYIKLQMLEQQIMQVQQNIQLLENQKAELMNTEQAIEDLENTKLGSESLSQLAPGVFVKTELKENKNLIINVGSCIAASKTTEQVKKMVSDQLIQIKLVQSQLMDDLQKLALQAQFVQEGMGEKDV